MGSYRGLKIGGAILLLGVLLVSVVLYAQTRLATQQHERDTAQQQPAPVEVVYTPPAESHNDTPVPAELPETGFSAPVVLLGLVGYTLGFAYYFDSRRRRIGASL